MKNIGLTFGWQVTGWVLIGVMVLVLLLIGIGFLVAHFNWDGELWVMFGVIIGAAWVLGLVAVVITWFVIPAENRVNYVIDGTVVKVSNSFLSGSGDATLTGFTFTIDNSTEILRTDDARIQQLVGEHVNLICTQEWVARGQDYYTCRLNG